MSKEEFLKELRESLLMEIPVNEVESNIRYYNDYIEGELRKGKTLNQVMVELGDPRLIARTIIETSAYSQDTVYGTHRSGAERNYSEDTTYESTQEDSNYRYRKGSKTYHKSRFMSIVYQIMFLVFIFVILYVVLRISSLLFVFLLRLGLPILLIFILFQLFKRH